jgi:hypothetical protein
MQFFSLAQGFPMRASIIVCSLALAAGCLEGPGTPDQLNVSITEQGLTGYKVVTAETPLSLQPLFLQPACPTGSQVLGAGWGLLDDTGAIFDGVATYSAPSFDGASWLVIAHRATISSTPLKLQVRLLCGRLAGYEVVLVDTAVSAEGSKQLSLGCPVDKVILGAGFGVLDPTGGILDGDALFFGANGNDWLINARNNSGFASTWKLHGRLVCVSATAVTGYEIVTVDTAVSIFGEKQLTTSCPSGKHTTGFGWGVLDSTSAILDGQATYSQAALDGRSWLVNTRNFNTSFAPTWKLRGQAICTR